jgi:hypothetical protein
MSKHAYNNGQKARRRQRPRNDNPYFGKSSAVLKFRMWDKGWRDEDAIILALSPENGWKPSKEERHV